MIVFEIQELPKMPNSLLGAHWTIRSTHAKKWSRLIWAALGAQKPRRPWATVDLTLERHSSVEPDEDGLSGSFKAVRDALVSNGVIENDKPQNILRSKCVWVKAKPGKGKIRVMIQQINGDPK